MKRLGWPETPKIPARAIASVRSFSPAASGQMSRACDTSCLGRRDKATLLSLVEVLDDPTPMYRREDCPQFRPDYPLADRMTFLTLRPFLEQTFSRPANTIGQTALEALKKMTKRDFGTNTQKWKNYVQKSR